MSEGETALLTVLVARGTLGWHDARDAAGLDDDALSNAVETLLARGAIRIVRSQVPSPVALAIDRRPSGDQLRSTL